MARRLTSFNFNPPKEVADHPMARYLDGNIWKLYPSDFPDKTTKSVKHSLQILCNKRGYNLEHRFLNNGELVIRATKKEQ